MVSPDNNRERGRLGHKGMSSGGDTGGRYEGKAGPSTDLGPSFRLGESGPEYLGPRFLLGGIWTRVSDPEFSLCGICVWARVFPG